MTTRRHLLLGHTSAASSSFCMQMQTFYTGFGVLLVAFGGHSISFEVMDSMNTPK